MKVALAHHRDQIRAAEGDVPASAIRRTQAERCVDAATTRLVLPAKFVEQLDFEPVERTRARLADASTIERDLVQDVALTLLGRAGVFKAIVEPNRDDALIGAIVLEDLDMVADPVTATCHPRDPDWITTEIE